MNRQNEIECTSTVGCMQVFGEVTDGLETLAKLEEVRGGL